MGAGALRTVCGGRQVRVWPGQAGCVACGSGKAMVFSPDFPRSVTRRPQPVEQLEFLKSVHRLPKPGVRIRAQHAVRRHLLHGTLLQHDAGIVGQKIKQARAADHVAAVDEATLRLRFLVETLDPGLPEIQLPEATRGMHGGERAGFPAGLMLPHDAGDIDRPHPVAIGEVEVFVRPEVFPDEPDSVGGHGILPRVGECHRPVLLAMGVVKLYGRSTTKHQGGVAGVPKVIPEIVFDHVALVAETEDELLVAVAGVSLHDMPEDGAIPDRHHRLGSKFGLLAEPSAFAATQDYDFHG